MNFFTRHIKRRDLLREAYSQYIREENRDAQTPAESLARTRRLVELESRARWLAPGLCGAVERFFVRYAEIDRSMSYN